MTYAIPELEKRPDLLPLLRDPDISYSLRQDGKGLILGPYERNPVAWAVDGVPAQLGQGVIKTVGSGPIVSSPDGLALLGPVHGYDNYCACAGVSFGITQGGGASRYLAQGIMHGHPEVDLWELDSRRFGIYASLMYTVSRALEVYANENQPGQPNKYAMRAACREQKTLFPKHWTVSRAFQPFMVDCAVLRRTSETAAR